MNASWRLKRALLTAALIVMASACMGRELTRIDPVTETYVVDTLHNVSFEGVDILVVVDNSGSMEAEQRMLETAFPELIRSILTGTDLEGNIVHPPLRDLHVGVISTDMGVGGYDDVESCRIDPLSGDDGILQNEPRLLDCQSSYPTFLAYEIGDTEVPDPAVVDRLSRDFGCIAVLGTEGCGFEQQLEASRKALVEHGVPGGANDGFLREKSILTVLFVTDEEDCSAADPTLFDKTQFDYSLNLRCYYESGKLHAIERYVEAFKSLRANLEDLVLGFIVGVPPGAEACNGSGDAIGGCLGLPEMGERVNGEGDLLEYVCMYPPGCTPGRDGNCSSEAFPARRFVQLAQAFGENAVVSSICADSFLPAVEALTKKIQDKIVAKVFKRPLAVDKDPLDPCRCVADCVIVEEMSDAASCPDGKPAYDGDGDTVGDVKIDPATGQAHTLCEIPQAGAVINNGTSCDVDCDAPGVAYAMDTTSTGAGWWYDPTEDWNEDGVPDPTVRFTGVEPEGGSTITIQCLSTICSELTRCGPRGALDSKCCHANEYCYRPAGLDDVEGSCLLRQDVCEGFGDDLWCPAAGPLAADPLIGGLCCLDQDMDGALDWLPVEEGKIPEDPAFRCEASACVHR